MKTPFYIKIFFVLVVAAAGANISQAQEQSMPPSTGEALPANILPSSPLAEVIKLAQAGVDVGVIRSYVANTTGTFNLDAEKILYLNDIGVPKDIINAMMDHDKNYPVASAASVNQPPPSSVPDTAPPPTEVDVNYFYNNLTPYGSWVEIEGYGRCWRPTTVIYDSAWQPYCDRGHWVYSDCGWYWNSDYSWGATFHYGRWFRNPRFGWCWWPDTVWAPSWVTWRSSDDYCGWAPLPPFTVYRPGLGFYYRGALVSVGFNFGLDAGCFTFVSPNHFSDRRPRYYRADREHVNQFFNRTTVINNYNVNNRAIFNGGIPVNRINAATHQTMKVVPVAKIPNAERQGWRGNGNDSKSRPVGGSPADNRSRNVSPGNNQSHQSPAIPNNQNNYSHPPASTQPSGQSGNRNIPNHNSGAAVETHQYVAPPVGNNPHPSQPAVNPAHYPQADNHSTSRDIPNRNSGAAVETHQSATPPASNYQRTQPPQNNWQQSRSSQTHSSPVLTSPRNSVPAAPPMSQGQSRGSDRGSDNSRQNH